MYKELWNEPSNRNPNRAGVPHRLLRHSPYPTIETTQGDVDLDYCYTHHKWLPRTATAVKGEDDER